MSDYREAWVNVLYKIDVEGLDYAVTNGYAMDDALAGDTEWVETVNAAEKAINALEALIEARREEYGIEIC